MITFRHPEVFGTVDTVEGFDAVGAALFSID
jgi:hypothetical protein